MQLFYIFADICLYRFSHSYSDPSLHPRLRKRVVIIHVIVCLTCFFSLTTWSGEIQKNSPISRTLRLALWALHAVKRMKMMLLTYYSQDMDQLNYPSQQIDQLNYHSHQAGDTECSCPLLMSGYIVSDLTLTHESVLTRALKWQHLENVIISLSDDCWSVETSSLRVTEI